VLVQLGARASDLDLDQRGCPAPSGAARVDVTFSVLVPTNEMGKSVEGAPVEAQWQTVQLRGAGCDFLDRVNKEILPLFSTRSARLISKDDCHKLNDDGLHVGLRAEVLKPR